MTAAVRSPDPQEVAAAAARLAGTPEQLGARLRALLDAGPPRPARGETGEAAADRLRATQRQAEEVEALRTRLAADFAEARGWRPTTAPLAVKELARCASPGGNWHKPAREWLGTLFVPTFYRDASRRAAAMVAHPLAEQVERDRPAIEAWAAERELVASFPDTPSWHDPVRSVVAVLEPAASVAAPVRSPVDPASTPAGVAAEPHVMRPVAPVDLGGAVPRDLTDEDDPDFDVVDPATLLIDEGYQRGLTPKSLALIRRIVANWSWSKFKVPTCVRVDGQLHVLDGQHSAIAAASHPGIGAIPVLIAKVPEAADRAAAFVSHATDRLQTTITQVHHAAVLAGDEDALTIDRVCRMAGIELVAFPPTRSAYRPRQTIALNAIRRVVDKRGAMRARQILEALAQVDLAPISADHIRVAEALLCDPDYAADFTPEKVTAAFKALDARALADAKAISVTKHLPAWRGLVAVIYRGRKARPKGARHAEAVPAGDLADVEEAAA